MAFDVNRMEIDRIRNLVKGFDWESVKEEITDDDLILTIKKKRATPPEESGAGPD